VLMLIHFRKHRTHSIRLFLVLLGYGIFLVGFSLWEWWKVGQVTGGDRYPNTDQIPDLLQSLMTESGNQLVVFKDFTGSSSFSFWA